MVTAHPIAKVDPLITHWLLGTSVAFAVDAVLLLAFRYQAVDPQAAIGASGLIALALLVPPAWHKVASAFALTATISLALFAALFFYGG